MLGLDALRPDRRASPATTLGATGRCRIIYHTLRVLAELRL
jgi:hypothetical protein